VSQLGPVFDREVRRDERRAEQNQGIVRPGQYERREKFKSIFQSILEDAKGSPIYGAFANLGRAAAKTAPFFTSQIEREEGLAPERTAAASLIPGGNLANKPITSFIGAAEEAGNIWNTFVMRPLTAAALATDPESPLYDQGVYEDTEQGRRLVKPTNPIDALRLSYNRSSGVSFGDSVFANSALTSIGQVGPVPGPLGRLADITQINTYNPWSDESVNEASENPVHYAMASILNLAPEFLFVPPARAARIKTQGALGVRTTVESGEQIASYRELWNEHQARKSSGVALEPDLPPRPVVPKDAPPKGKTKYITDIDYQDIRSITPDEYEYYANLIYNRPYKTSYTEDIQPGGVVNRTPFRSDRKPEEINYTTEAIRENKELFFPGGRLVGEGQLAGQGSSTYSPQGFKVLSGSALRGNDVFAHTPIIQMQEILLAKRFNSIYDNLVAEGNPVVQGVDSFDDFIDALYMRGSNPATQVGSSIGMGVDQNLVRIVNERFAKEVYGLDPDDTIRLYRMGSEDLTETAMGFYTTSIATAVSFKGAKRMFGETDLLAIDVKIKDLPQVFGVSGFADETAFAFPSGSTPKVKKVWVPEGYEGVRVRDVSERFIPNRKIPKSETRPKAKELEAIVLEEGADPAIIRSVIQPRPAVRGKSPKDSPSEYMEINLSALAGVGDPSTIRALIRIEELFLGGRGTFLKQRSASGTKDITLRDFFEGSPEASVTTPNMVPPQDGPLSAQDGYSMFVEDLATETRVGKILENPLVANASGVNRGKLADIISETNDPNTINELILASRGDYEAVYNLFQAAPDSVWRLADMSDVVRNTWIERGFDFTPRGEQLRLVNQIFDSPIKRDKYFSEVMDLFVTPDGFVKGGATWMPTGVMQVERVRKFGRDVKYAVTQADYEDAPQWISKTVNAGDGTPVSTFLQWSSSRQPLGTVSLSGTRPDDWITELRSQFNSVPMLRGNKMVTVGYEPNLVDGRAVPIQMPASQYRQQLMQQLMAESEEIGILPAWRRMEDRLITVMADEVGVSVDQALAFARGGRQNLAERFGYMAESGGYLFDAEVGRIIIHPKTLGQLADSFPTLPMDEIYRAMRSEESLLYRVGSTSQEYLTAAFDGGMKFFRTNVLFKPSYFFKFGALEPMIVSYLAHGTVWTDEGFIAMTKNVSKNWARRSKRVAYVLELNTLIKKFTSRDPVKTRAANREYLRTLVTERHLTERMLDEALMDLERLRGNKVSPARARNNEILIRNQLAEAQLRLDAIEDALDGNLPQWRQVVEPATYRDLSQKMSDYRAMLDGDPSYAKAIRDQIDEINRIARERTGGEPVYTPNENAMIIRLEASLRRIESKPKDMDAFRAEVDSLQARIDEIENLRENFTDPARRIEELNQALDLVDKKIGMTRVALGESRRKIDATGMSGYAGSGNGYMTIMVGGKPVQVPAVFSTRQFDFGEAMRSETSAALANRLLYDPSYAVSRSASRWKRTEEPVKINPEDPLYWEELAWVINSKFRDDPLVGRILQGKSRAQVAEWLATPEGRTYQKTMGMDYLVPRETYSDPVSRLPKTEVKPGERVPKSQPGPRMMLQSTTELDEMFRLVDQYIPDSQLRDAAAAAPVTPGQLQATLGNNPNLRPIAGDDFIYNPGGLGRRFIDRMNKALDVVWKAIATTPEDRIARWPFYQREFKKQLQLRVNIAESQGVKLDPEGGAMDALRQASKRAALEELEKTFYNIRRYNSPVYMSRFLMMFPGAVANSIYRYTRLAVKEPERTFQALVVADTILNEGAVDRDGNPTDLKNAEYIIVPGTKKGPGDKGLQVPVASIETLAVAMPSVAYLINIGVAVVVSQKPDVEDGIRRALGEGLFNELFPYGLPRDPSKAFWASYQKNFGKTAEALLRKALGQQVTDKEFLQTSVQFYAHKMAEWEQSGKDPSEAPQFDDAVSDTIGYYAQKTFLGWAPPFSVRTDVPGQLWRDNWYKIREQYGDDTPAAREAYIKQNGDWARWYTYSSSDYSAYIPSTQEAYKRVWVDHPDLARQIVAIASESGDLSMVSLLAVGTSGEFSQPVSDFLRNNPLPGDDVPVVSRKTPEQFESMILVEDGWNTYSRERAKFNAEQKRLRTLRDMPNLSSEQKQLYRDMIAENDSSFGSYVRDLKEANQPWALTFASRGTDRAEAAKIILKKMLSDEKFARTTGRSELFKNIGYFLEQRDKALQAIDNSKTAEGKKANKVSFLEYVNNEFLENSPEFASVFDRYFSSEWVVE
jgi:hypothetical protein